MKETNVGEENTEATSGSSTAALLRGVASCVAVVAVFFGVLILLRGRSSAKGEAELASGVRVLSRTPLTPRHQAILLQVGDRRVLVGVSKEGMTLLMDDLGEGSPSEERGRDASTRRGSQLELDELHSGLSGLTAERLAQSRGPREDWQSILGTEPATRRVSVGTTPKSSESV